MEVKFDPVLSNIHSINRRSESYLVYHFLVKSLSEVFNKYAKGRLLDIGCGNKPYEKLLTEKISCYTGCDFIQNKFNSVDHICDVTDIPLPSADFDTCLSTQVIEHVPNPDGLLKEAFRLLKPEGYLILSGPMYWPVHGEPYDYYRFTRFGFEQLLTRNGFTIIEVVENGGSWATAGQALVHGFEFSISRSIRIRILRFIFFKLRFISLINRFFEWADKKDFNKTNTINYVVIAQKPTFNK